MSGDYPKGHTHPESSAFATFSCKKGIENSGHNIFRKSLRDFVKKEIRPYAEEWEESEIYPKEIFKGAGMFAQYSQLLPYYYIFSTDDLDSMFRASKFIEFLQCVRA
jgi:hypothetical protein